MAVLNVPVVAPAVAKDLGIATTYLGAYVALVYFAAMVATLLGGAAVKRWGAIRLSQIGLVLASFGLLLSAYPHPLTIAVGALFIGAGYGPITPASSHLLIKTASPEKLSFVFSIKQTGVPLGGIIAGALVPTLNSLIGWQAAFLCAAWRARSVPGPFNRCATAWMTIETQASSLHLQQVLSCHLSLFFSTATYAACRSCRSCLRSVRCR
jgi:MFS family permease